MFGSMVEPGSQAEAVGRLFLAVMIVLFLPALPGGTYLIYPFVILTTWFHEMGHGLTALAMGQEFVRLQIFANGSGVAESRLATDVSPFVSAAIAAGGPLAPVIAGSALILASAHRKAWRPALWITAIALLASVIFYVRSPTGYAVLPLLAVLLVGIAWRAPAGLTRFSIQFLGVLASLSMLRDFNYLFTEEAVIGGQRMLSDTGQIEAALFLPHWFWAGAILLVSASMVLASLKYALNEKRLKGIPTKPPANVLQFRQKPPR
ncbi:MAG: M50 family metallopeptidase [Pseudomonadota bacterium]